MLLGTEPDIWPMDVIAWRAVMALTSVTYSLQSGTKQEMKGVRGKTKNIKNTDLSSSMIKFALESLAIFTSTVIFLLLMYEVSLKLKN